MIATPRFVFLHLHKSGGTFVNECLLRFVPGARQLGYHLPRSLIPPGIAALPVLGFVRSPWSYYVSWYTFQAARPTPNALFRILSEDGREDFAGTIRNMLELGQDSRHLDALLAALPQAYTNRGLNLTSGALASIRGSGLGFYAWLHRYLYGAEGPDHAGRMESLRTDLLAMLDTVGQPVDDAMRAYIEAAAPRNVSRHGDAGEYYADASLARLVAARDAPLIERYGYTFASVPADA